MTAAELLKAALLPPRGVEFEISYYDGDSELPRESILEEPHTHVNAVSPGLRVLAMGEGMKVFHRWQRKPFIEDGSADRVMLVVEHEGTFVHIIGELVVVADRKLRLGEILPTEE